MTHYDQLVPDSLRLISDSLDDLEGLHTATTNRYRSATSTWVDEKTGLIRGLGLDERDPLVASVAVLATALEEQKHQMVLKLQRELRKTIFSPWLKQQRGVGEKTLARLLASIGDPYIRTDVVKLDEKNIDIRETPRTLSALWGYSGLAVDNGTARRIPKGATQADVFACGKPTAKMRAYLVAECLVKAGVRTIDKDLKSDDKSYDLENRHAISRYGELYLARRAATIDRVHAHDCVRCGPAARPAKAGTPWSGAHQQADALRVLSKQVLKDLWLLAREHHTGIPVTAPIQHDDQALEADLPLAA
ncbi:MAG TPA: hypothetical protein VFU07_05330 [Candidatus Lumbricidophila sp.]|nr:hypothetical protein [Candidatus Lumbricidophila sp.]